MDISLIFKVAGVGIIVSAAAQILSKYGRDEQSTFVIISGILVTLFLLVNEISGLFASVREIFGL